MNPVWVEEAQHACQGLFKADLAAVALHMLRSDHLHSASLPLAFMRKWVTVRSL